MQVFSHCHSPSCQLRVTVRGLMEPYCTVSVCHRRCRKSVLSFVVLIIKMYHPSSNVPLPCNARALFILTEPDHVVIVSDFSIISYVGFSIKVVIAHELHQTLYQNYWVRADGYHVTFFSVPYKLDSYMRLIVGSIIGWVRWYIPLN